MKKIISFLTVLCIAFLLVSCNAIHTKVSGDRPSDKTIIEVEAEDFGNNVYFTTKKELTELSVNRMSYNEQTNEFSVEKTVYKKDVMKTDECLKIVLDLESHLPYVMVSYKIGEKTYEQYIYKNFETDKMLLLELES